MGVTVVELCGGPSDGRLVELDDDLLIVNVATTCQHCAAGYPDGRVPVQQYRRDPGDMATFHFVSPGPA